MLTWKCASRHNSVQFFISHLANWLRTRRFSEPTFRPSGETNHWKNTAFRDFPTFSCICIFILLSLSLLLFSLLIFSLLSASALLCFSSVHTVGSLTSKLPSTTETKLHYTNYTTLPLQLHYTKLRTTTAAQHHTTSSSCGGGDHCNHCNHSKKHNSNHLSVYHWIRSVIRDSQQPTSPIGFRFLKLPPPPCAVLLVKLHLHFVMCLPIESIEIAEFHSCKVDPIWTWGAASLAVTGSTVQLFPAKVAKHATRMKISTSRNRVVLLISTNLDDFSVQHASVRSWRLPTAFWGEPPWIYPGIKNKNDQGDTCCPGVGACTVYQTMSWLLWQYLSMSFHAGKKPKRVLWPSW